MPKREADLSDSDSLSDDSSSEEAPVKKPRKQSSDEAPAKKAPKPESTSSDEAPVKKPLKQKAAAREQHSKPAPKKKAKKKYKSDSGDSSEEDASSNGLEPGAYWLDEKRMRRIQVRSFKGKPLIDIREMYMGANGIAPGKKGISLSIPEWRKLEKLMKKVDDEILKIT